MASASTLLSVLIGVIAFATPTVLAQPASPEPTNLVLEVHFYPKEIPAYQTVPAATPGGAWYARFGRVPGWTPPPASPAVTAVNIKSELAEDGVRVWVSVFLGVLHEQENKVGSYILHEGEKVSVRELAQVGVEPFEIKVVRLNPSVGEAPQFSSKAKSIEVVGMQPNFTTLPSYEVVVRNVSGRNVSALRVQVLQAGRPRITSMPQGKEGQPLIVPSGSCQFTATLVTRAMLTPDGYAPAILPNQIIEITSAMFDDGSFEGEPDAAIAFTAYQKGRKIQLAKVLDLLQRSLASSDAPSAVLGSLKTELTTLTFAADWAAVNEVHARFPGMPADREQRLKTTIEVGMKGVRDELLKDLTEFQLRNRRPGSNTFHDWLTTSKERYQAWFARL